MIENRMPVNVFFFLLLVITGFAYAAAGQTAAGIFFIAASLLACLLMILRLEDPFLRYLILTFLVIRVGLALVQVYTGFNLPGAGADSVTFENEAWKNTQAWLYGGVTGHTTGAYYFSSLIGIIYVFFGRFEFIPQLLIVYVSLLNIYLLYRLSFLVTGLRQGARFAALFIAILPAMNSYSAVLSRETLIYFFIGLSFYFLIRWTKQGKLILLGASFAALAVAGFFHAVIFLLLWVHLLMICFFSPQEQRFRLVFWQFIPAAVFVVLASLLLGDYLTYQLPSNLTDLFTPDFMRNVVERKTTGRTSYLLEMVPYTYLDLAWQTPIRIVYFLFAPFPWMIEAAQDILGFVDVLLYLGLFYFAYIGSRFLWAGNKQVVVAALLMVISLVVMFAWGTTNYGTAWRHRQKIAPFVVMLSSAGVVASKKLRYLDDEEIEIELERRGCQLGEN